MVESVEIHEHPNSLEKFTQGGKVLFKIGVGRMLSPGHPAGNQQLHSQMPFFKSSYLLSINGGLPVYRLTYGKRVFMGNYVLVDYKKRMSFEGFTYFLFILHRREKFDEKHL